MTFRAPRMTYAPRTLEGWEHVISFTVIDAPYDVVRPVAVSVIRARQGPSGEIEGERRPPMMALDQMQKAATDGRDGKAASLIVEGVLIYSPAEAPHLTVIEHPLDYVGPAGFPEDLSRIMPDTRLVTFDSELETTARAFHGVSVRRGAAVERRVHLSRGHETSAWYWEDEGEPQPFEDNTRLAKKRIWERLDRPLIFDYAAKLGLSLDDTLFGRNFAASVYYYPLAHDSPEAIAFAANIQPEAAFDAGVETSLGIPLSDKEFPQLAGFIGANMKWERQIDQARVKAWSSAKSAKTPAGRERAQWRVVDTVREIAEDMRQYDVAEEHIELCLGTLSPPMEALGTKTEAYRVFKGLARNPFLVFEPR